VSGSYQNARPDVSGMGVRMLPEFAIVKEYIESFLYLPSREYS
jgi:hypothetical protein